MRVIAWISFPLFSDISVFELASLSAACSRAINRQLRQTSYILLAAILLASLYVLIREEISYKSAAH